MTLDEAKKLKSGELVLFDGLGSSPSTLYYIGFTRIGLIFLENEAGVICQLYPSGLNRPLVYEWLWVYEHSAGLGITDVYFTESEASKNEPLIQRIDSTKRMRES